MRWREVLASSRIVEAAAQADPLLHRDTRMTRMFLWGLLMVVAVLVSVRVAGTDLAAPFAVGVFATGWLMAKIA